MDFKALNVLPKTFQYRSSQLSHLLLSLPKGAVYLKASTQLKAFAELALRPPPPPPVFANSVLSSRFREGASGGFMSFFHAAPVNKQMGVISGLPIVTLRDCYQAEQFSL
uniref:Uncharacterized protein n=1 Tax=Timema shepardi TaxID=629360 RepID=A0A7R9B343_TIMSH|nr:unnamed protein product [Timema shepardi]